jgi:RNA polymerase sigma-70 factor (ECF subfamily)
MASIPKATAEADASAPSTRGRLDDLARRYYAPLATFFRKRTRNAPEVQDLVQQVFLRLAQYGDLHDIQNADGYIFQTAANTLRDHYRRTAVEQRFTTRQAGVPAAADADFSAERVLLGRESLAVLTAALRQLPERTRDVFMLRCFEGLKHAEIARLQGISVRAVEKHVCRALAHLGEALERAATE